MNAPRAVQGIFLVVLILFVAASIKHTSNPTFAASKSHKKPSSGSTQSQSSWNLDRLKPQFLGGVRLKLEREEAIWEKTVEQRHKMLKDYKDPNNKDMFVKLISSYE
jgi:hypothetical protein